MSRRRQFGETTSDLKASDDTMSSESAVNLDQGDPLAEADFHMAYGLYDQAADLVRIALEREPDRRDLRLKLLGNLFRLGQQGRVPADRQGTGGDPRPCSGRRVGQDRHHGQADLPRRADVRLQAGSGRGAGALVDLNLEGGENRVDIDLFGDPEGERSTSIIPSRRTTMTMRRPANRLDLHAGSDLDFTLDPAGARRG